MSEVYTKQTSRKWEGKGEKRTIVVWDVTFALEDENGDVIYNDKGDVEIYRNDEGDYTHLADELEPEDLEIHDYC